MRLLRSAALCLAITQCASPGPPPRLTDLEARQALAGKPRDLEFVLHSGRDPSASGCETKSLLSQEVAAVAAGLLLVRCLGRHRDFKLTIEGWRRSAGWTGISAPARGGTTVTWRFPIARFERVGMPEIQGTNDPARPRVILHGHWILNADGRLLRRAGWTIEGPAHREYRLQWRGREWRVERRAVSDRMPGLQL